MATYATLTVPVQDIIGADFNASRASVWIEPNVPFVLADSIRVGGRREQVVNGVATFANLVTTDTADNPASFGYRVTITAPPKGAAARKDIVNLTTADFPFTATASLTDISEAWDNVVLPVEWRSAFRDEMEALRDQVQDLSGISTPDGVVAALVPTSSGSATATALADTYGVRKSDATSEVATTGAELVDASDWTLGTGWSGSYAAGFTHTPGNTAALTFAGLGLTGTKTYMVEFVVDSPTDSSAFTVTIGGSFGMVMYEGANGGTWTYRRGITSVSDGNLVFTPESAFDGTIRSVSVKEVTASTTAPFSWEDSTGTDALEIRPTTAALDNVFVGKDNGRFNITGKENAVVGHRAMRANVTGFWNSAIGHQALEANVNGSRNAALGYLALQSNISGHRNVAISSFALRANTHGINNIAIGADAVWQNTTGSYNIGIGLAALSESVTGNENVAVGVAALANINGKSGNVAIGDYAMALGTAGVDPSVAVGQDALRNTNTGGHVAVGFEALTSNTTGTGNTAVGHRAARSTATVNQQTAIGTDALRYNTGGRNTVVGFAAMVGAAGTSTGTRNVVVGDSAGTGITSGSNNVIFGGSSGSTVTSGTGNILIGFNVQAPSATDNNHLNIGNTIYGNVSTKRVGFGTITAPTARVHLPGTTTTANTAPLKLDAGTLMTTPEAGAFEFTTAGLFFTDHLGTRKQVTLV